MSKSAVVIIYYLFLIYEFYTGEPAVFMMLFSLLMELVLILVVFTVFAFIKPRRKNEVLNAFSFIAAAPLLIFQYGIAMAISSSLHEYSGTGPFAPIIAFQVPVTISIVFLLLIYGLNVYDLIKKKYSIEVVERGVIFQALIISATGLTGVLLFALLDQPDKITILTGIALGRIVFEFMINRQLNYMAKP